MGALISSHRSFSFFRVYQPSKMERRRGSHLTEKQKRSSMNRPVLRLQINAETLRRRGSDITSTLTRESGVYDNLMPKRSSSVPNRLHHRSSDPMVVVQFIDNGSYDMSDRKDDNDYDRLLPRGEFEHLCTCTYTRVNSSESGSLSRDSHFSTINIRDGSQPQISQELDLVELRERIMQHAPPVRSKSTDGISGYRVRDNHAPYPRRRYAHSTSNLDDEFDWSLGESVLKTLTEGGFHVFNIENPSHESEMEINRTWPHLREKLKKWRQSQQSLNCLDGSVFTEDIC